ncbi:DUF4286 family protein [Mycolicibacterium holsaticum]|uniref:DUF4286 family protein n=1 Tax=Mycolicibacterium holsaticum TaxID=152142 RepID=UPI001C7CF612|nr:DUF4286 family protein [Mycolicibacterium holsaticum]MDA4106818.1 hypothetical protein [Mycolicibacterium holsaticum DSM 44478 = JCM 12374]QZA14063.1 hypothetical protein K3U96_08090 [Mycolicibacterium holsaticum DSM 44478 = JCM 12374]UNC08478.1 hypothetical protein H5U41_18740 [Mycolicibacterium holsaticum DSM 44478 = JCM 12374]
MTDKFIQIVFSNPLDGRDDEFNDWYDNVHIPDLLAIPGMLSAQRYDLKNAEIYDMEGGTAPEHRYAIIYEMEGDVDTILNKIQDGVTAGKITMADCLDMSSWRLSFWAPRGPKATA